MGSFVPGNAGRFGSGSWLARVLQRPHADTFVCGTRWPDADKAHARRSWRYRRAWVDPYRTDGVRTIEFADKTALRIRLDAMPWWRGGGPAPRPGHVVLASRTVDGSPVLLAVPQRELARFDLEAL